MAPKTRTIFLTTVLCLFASACALPLPQGTTIEQTKSSSYSFPDTCEEHLSRTLIATTNMALLVAKAEQLPLLPGNRALDYSNDDEMFFRNTYPELYKEANIMQNLARTQSIVCEPDKTNNGRDITTDYWLIENLSKHMGETPNEHGQNFLKDRIGIFCGLAGSSLLARLETEPPSMTWENIGMPKEAALVCDNYAPLQQY